VWRELHKGEFVLTEVYQSIPDGLVLPKGCDIRVDVQSGEIWAKLPSSSSSMSSSLIPIVEDHQETPSVPHPEYKNLTKSRIIGRLSSDTIDAIAVALDSLHEDSSWTFLEDEAPAMEFSLGLFDAANFGKFREFLALGDERALQVLAICLQNNPLAVERAFELNLLESELAVLLKSEFLEKLPFKRLLRVLESLASYGNGDLTNFIENYRQELERHQQALQGQLEKRYEEIIKALLLSE